jgi:uncharacterized protein
MEKLKSNKKYSSMILLLIAAGAALAALWFNLEAVATGITNLFPFEKGGRLYDSVHFFLFDVPKVMILLTVIVFAVGIIRSFFSAEKTRNYLEGKPLFVGNILASLLGVVTPFCSCSAVPLFLGFVEAGIPLGVTFSFLIAAPMINEVALVMLFALFGWKTALLYAGTGLLIAMFAGYIIGKLKLERFVEDWVYSVHSKVHSENVFVAAYYRIYSGIQAVHDIVKKVWLYVVLGIAVGAAIHGYVPENMMASIMGKGAWYSVPLAVLIGVPMYSNAAGIIPILQALLEKGASLGTALAFMMAVIGLSLPEMIILRRVLKVRLIIIFAGIVAVGIMIVGYIFNIIY